MKRGKLIAAIMLSYLLALGVCSSIAAEKVLKIGIRSADMGILDPHLSATTANMPIMDSIFNGLVRFTPGDIDLNKIEPDLAERWQPSPDGKIWTFYLRKGIQFHHDFGEMTADDVVFSLKKASAKETSSWHSDYKEFEKVEAVDRYTVKITLSHNVPSLLGMVINFHGGMVLSKKAVEKYGEQFKMNPVGTGPFAFKEYLPKQQTVLVAHEKYFRGRPRLDKLIYYFNPIDQTRELAFLKGEMDMIEGIKQDWWIKKMSKEKDVIIDAFPPGEEFVMHFNMTRKPLDNLKVRMAIAHALNRTEFREAYGGLSITGDAFSVVSPGYLGYADDVKKYEFNVERGKTLMKEAGYPEGFDLGDLVTSSNFLSRVELLQNQLKKIGIKFTIKMVDHPTMHKMIRQDVNPIVPYGCARFPVADSILTPFYHSDSIVGTPKGIDNFSHYGKVIPGVDDLLNKARVEPNQEKQKEMWQQAQKKIMEDVPAYPLFLTYVLMARHKNIDLGYEPKTNMTLHYQITEKTSIK